MIPYLLGALLALAGGALSVYFHGVHAGWFSSRQWWIPGFCRMEEQQCTSIVDTSFGTTLGKPNAFYGTLFYPVYFLLLILTAHGHINPLFPLAVAVVTVLAGVYLTYGLLKLKAACAVCLTAHGLNLVNFLIQLWAYTF